MSESTPTPYDMEEIITIARAELLLPEHAQTVQYLQIHEVQKTSGELQPVAVQPYDEETVSVYFPIVDCSYGKI